MVYGPVQEAKVVSILLQQLQVLVKKKYPDVSVRAGLTRQEVSGGLDCLRPASNSQPLEKQSHNVNFAKRRIWPSVGHAGLRGCILNGAILMATAVLEAPQRLRNSVLQNFDILGAKVLDQLVVLVPHDDVEQDLLGG